MNFPAEPTPDQQAAARLTAWALRELPADSLTEFEAHVQADPDMETQAAGTREFCQLLESSLTAPSAAPLTLSPAIRQHLEAAAQPPAKSKVSLWMPSLAAAACFAVMLGVYSQSRRSPALLHLTAQNGNTQAPSSAAKKQEFLQQLEKSQFFLTHKSQSPELNTHGNPRVSVFPTDLLPNFPSDQEAPRAEIPAAPAASPLPELAAKERLLLRIGLGYYDLGQFQEAKRSFNQVLAFNPESTVARRLLERTESEVNNYYRAARDHTRIKMLNDVDSLWVTPVPAGEATPESLAEIQPIEPDGVKSADTLEGQSIFKTVMDAPLSTFSIDVDTASYAIARRHLNEGQRPPLDSVRLEEMINYFPMDDAPPVDGKPFAVQVETASAPWAPAHRLVRVALKGKLPPTEERRPAHLVFLVDTSGSMGQPNKLPLVQQSLRLLLDQLAPQDQVTLVTYAGDSELRLPATPVAERARIATAIDALTSGGSTNGSGGIMAAYQQARAHFQEGGVNRVILATDGDFNVGLTGAEDLETLISREAKSGVYLSVLAYGSDNLKDKTAELLADKGNGNYAYIDSLGEARRALVSQLQGTLVTIAKDVKIQVEFNPAQVASYRLLGYENRALANKDFNDDTKDAGEIGAGHSVTALYEIVPPGHTAPSASAVDVLKYQTPPPPANSLTAQAASGELLTVKLRYQQPEGTAPSQLIEVPVKDSGLSWEQASANFRWTAAAAGYALLLRDSKLAGTLDWPLVRTLAAGAKGADPDGFRGEFLQLVEKAAGLVPPRQ